MVCGSAVREAYARLRRVLNRIRMWDGGSATSMPSEAEGRADLAHRLGLSGDLLEYVDRYRHEVAALYGKTYAAARYNARGPDTPG